MSRRKALPPSIRTAAFQQQVREAGVTTRDLRISGKVFGICAACALALLALTTMLSAFEAAWPLLLLPLGVICVVMSVLLLILPVTACYREWRTHGIRRAIVQMSPEERATALEPLRSDAAPETRDLAAALLREFGARTEIVPAAAPEGRGSEPVAD